MEDLNIKLDIRIKNQIKAVIIAGLEAKEEGSDKTGLFSPEILVDANLDQVIINFTPDVYNGLVNIGQVIS